MTHDTTHKSHVPKGDYEVFEETRWSSKDQQLVFRHRAAYSLWQKTGGDSFLDIGCGDGVFEKFVKEKHPKSVCSGIDLSEIAIQTAKSNVPDVEFQVRDVLKEGIPYADNTFDAVIALDVLEHVFQPHILLQEIKRVTKKYAIIGVPNFSSFPSRVQMLFGRVPENNRPKKGHAYWFTISVLKNLLEENGFVIREIKTNYQLERFPVLGAFFALLTRIFPGMFALSFIILAEKTSLSQDHKFVL